MGDAKSDAKKIAKNENAKTSINVDNSAKIGKNSQ
jgi:hypothetical protein